MIKIKKFLNKYKYYILSLVIPIILILFVFLCNFIFIKNSILYGDLRSQYLDFFNYYKNLFNGNESLLYSFSNGLGDNMIGTFSYYLGSPLNLILLLFSTKNIEIGISIILIIKLSLSSLAMFIFLKNTFNYKKEKYILIFSICYALTMYSGQYFMNLMWFDGVYLAPLILLGINKIVENKSCLLYYVCLLLAILFNYYIGFMLCIFSLIYFIYIILLKYNLKKDKITVKKLIKKFIITSLLAAFSTLIFLLPTLYQMTNTSKNVSGITSIKPEFKFEILNNLNNIFIGRYDEVPYNSNLLLYCGMIIVILNIFYFINKKISKKEKILSLGVIIVFVISFSSNILNCVWHGFATPNGYVYRNLFLLILFMIILAFKAFINLKEIKKQSYFVVATIITLLLVLVQLNTKFEQIDVMGLISIALTYLYLVCLYIISNKNKFDKKSIKILEKLLIGVVCLEVTFNFFLLISKLDLFYKKEYEDYITVFNSKISDITEKDNTLFYRLHSDKEYGSNDGFLLDINTLSGFNSTMSKNYTRFYHKLGINQVNQATNYDFGRNTFTDSLLGAKYLILESKQSKYIELDKFEYCKYTGKLYIEEAPKTNYYFYQNPYALSLGFMINDAIIDENNRKAGEGLYGYDYQNYMYILTTESIDNILYSKINTSKTINKQTYEYKFKIDSTKDIYVYSNVYFQKEKDAKINLYINDELISIYSILDFSGIKIENKYNIGDEISVSIELSEGGKIVNEPRFYYYNEELIEKFYNEMSKNQLDITSFKDNNIKGTITATKDKNVMFTSIPYDKGWTVKVDGKKVETLKLYDALLGVKLEEGKHKIEFSYFPPGLKLGAIISSISFILFILYFKFENKIIKK